MYRNVLCCHSAAKSSLVLLALFSSMACSGQRARSEWDNIDYSSVYRRAAQRENDSRYEPTGDVGCLDDDLYSCR